MERIKQFFKTDRFAEYAGITLLSVTEGGAVARMLVEPHHLNGMKSVHGGAIFTLADFTFAAAANSHGNIAVAINCSITYMKAVTAGSTLTAEARETTKNPKLGTYTVHIRNEIDEVIAIFQGLAYRKSEKIAL